MKAGFAAVFLAKVTSYRIQSDGGDGEMHMMQQGHFSTRDTLEAPPCKVPLVCACSDEPAIPYDYYIDWNICTSDVETGKGGRFPIRYKDVAPDVDLVLTNLTNYLALAPEKNGRNGCVGQLNIAAPGSVQIKFSLVNAGTDDLVSVGPTYEMTVFDLDQSERGMKEMVGVSEYSSIEATSLKPTKSDGVTWFRATDVEVINPDTTVLDMLRPDQIDASFSVSYSGTSEWVVHFEAEFEGSHKKRRKNGGRNFFFSGASCASAGRHECQCPEYADTPAPTVAPTPSPTPSPTRSKEPVPVAPPKLCSGSTSVHATQWQKFGCGVFVDVDTSSCGFTSTPRYFTSLGGNTEHWKTTGVSSLYDETASGFRVYLTQDGCADLNLALESKWHVNWVAQSTEDGFSADGSCVAGSTPAGSTNWATFGYNVVVTVDTSSCHFDTVPLYFTSMGGSTEHWSTTGATSIYSPMASSLQVYVSQLGGVTPELANEKQWNIRSLAIRAGLTGDTCTGSTKGHTNWQPFANEGVYVDVDTSSCGFSSRPLYFTTIGGTTRHWETTGATSIYQPTKNGFRVYIRETSGYVASPSEANQMGWHINWLAMKQ